MGGTDRDPVPTCKEFVKNVVVLLSALYRVLKSRVWNRCLLTVLAMQDVSAPIPYLGGHKNCGVLGDLLTNSASTGLSKDSGSILTKKRYKAKNNVITSYENAYICWNWIFILFLVDGATIPP